MEKKTIFELERISIEEFHHSKKTPLVIVLDNIRSLNNIGSIFRTCDAFRIERILLCGISATPPSPEIHKTALGAEDSVDWEYFADTMEAVGILKEEGYEVFALEQAHGSISLEGFEPDKTKKYAIIAGNEVDGVQPQVVSAADNCLEIPQFGTKHSLNVSVSTAIAIWHIARRLIEF